MGWLRKRIGERSTVNGFTLLSSALGIYLGPAEADIIITSVMSLYGVYEAARHEVN
jgi:hypothetical protein